MAWYSGAIYDLEAMKFRLTGPYGWVYYAGGMLPLLPVFGVIPGIGRRPLLMAGLAVLALVPLGFVLLVWRRA